VVFFRTRHQRRLYDARNPHTRRGTSRRNRHCAGYLNAGEGAQQMSALRSLAFGVGILIAVSGCGGLVSTADDEASLKEATQTWLKAYNAGDADTIAALYADDGVLMPPHAPVVTGKAAIHEYIARDSAGAKAAGIKLVPGAATVGVDHGTGWESG